MEKPPSVNHSSNGIELYVYKHILAADFDSRQWRDDATGRLIIHRDECPWPSGRGACWCHQNGRGVDILWLVPQRR
jgi:hypothetical protein